MTLRHSEFTTLRAAYSRDDSPRIPVALFAFGADSLTREAAVHVDLGELGGSVKVGLVLHPRAARELAMLLASFADIAEGLVQIADEGKAAKRPRLLCPYHDGYIDEHDNDGGCPGSRTGLGSGRLAGESVEDYRARIAARRKPFTPPPPDPPVLTAEGRRVLAEHYTDEIERSALTGEGEAAAAMCQFIEEDR